MTQKEFKCSIPAIAPVNSNANESGGSCLPADRETGSGDLECWVLALVLIVLLSLIWIWCSSFGDSTKTPEFHINSVSISPFNASSVNNQTTTPSSSSFYNNNWNMSISFVAKNTMKKKKKEGCLLYDMIHASLFYEKVLLSETDNIGAFYELGVVEEQAVVNATFTTDSTQVDHRVVDAMDEYRKQGKTLKFNVLVQAKATLNPFSLSNVQEKWMTVNCKDIIVQFLSDTTVLGTKQTLVYCDVVFTPYEDDDNNS